MDSGILLYAVVFWFILALIAIINGWARNTIYSLRLGELRAHQVSSVIMVVLVFGVSYVFLQLTGGYSARDLWFVGVLWVSLTVIFEFVFGHFVVGHSWGHLLSDYNVLKGRIWLLVLIASLTAPYLIYSLIL